MSLINRMLRDLDSRKGRGGGEPVASGLLRVVAPQSGRRLRLAVVLVIGALGVSMAAGAWLQRRIVVASSPAAASAPPPIAAAKAVQPAASTVALANAAASAVAAEAASASNVPAVAPVHLSELYLPVVAQAPEQVAPNSGLHFESTRISTAAIGATDAAATAAIAAIAARAEQGGPAPIPRTAALAESLPASTVQTALSVPVEPQLPSKAGVAVTKAVSEKTYSPEQMNANRFSEAVSLEQQGQKEQAKLQVQHLLANNPFDVPSRQMLVRLHLETGQVEQARALLVEGLRLLPEQVGFTMTLARLQMEGGDLAGAIRLLEGDRFHTQADPQFHALLAAMLLRAERNGEAMQHYLVALRSDPANTTWLVGVGAAMEGVGNDADAVEAYRRAQRGADLTPELADFLNTRLARLQP
jgi:MSHA biogenesis protein MshN